MPLPVVGTLFMPLLRLTADGADHSLADLRQRLQVDLHLSDGDLAERIAGGQSKFVNRVSWAAVHLHRTGALERISQGVFRITGHGQEILQAGAQGLKPPLPAALNGPGPECGRNQP